MKPNTRQPPGDAAWKGPSELINWFGVYKPNTAEQLSIVVGPGDEAVRWRLMVASLTFPLGTDVNPLPSEHALPAAAVAMLA
jgi:hypothetical protein